MHLEPAHCTNEIKTTSHFVHSNSNDVNKYTLALADHLRESIHASRGSGGCAVEGRHQDVYSIFLIHDSQGQKLFLCACV